MRNNLRPGKTVTGYQHGPEKLPSFPGRDFLSRWKIALPPGREFRSRSVVSFARGGNFYGR